MPIIRNELYGIAFFEHNDCVVRSGKASIGLRLYHDDKPCCQSPLADLVRTNPVKAMNVIAHIRKAYQSCESDECDCSYSQGNTRENLPC